VTGSVLVLFSSYIYEKGLPPQLSYLYKKFPWLLKKVGKTDDHLTSEASEVALAAAPTTGQLPPKEELTAADKNV
jgi:hypothetical protein